MNKNSPVEIEQENYKLQIKYSPEAIKKKLMKFVSKSGDTFEISVDEMISFIALQVNQKTIAPLFVEVDKVDVVEVGRQLKCVLNEDMKKGQEISLNYTHPYPIEFALLEQAYNIAKIDESIPKITITTEYLEEVKKKLQPGMTEFIDNFYKSFKNVRLNK